MSDSENVPNNEDAEEARTKKFLKDLGPTPLSSNEHLLGYRWAPKDELKKRLERIIQEEYHNG